MVAQLKQETERLIDLLDRARQDLANAKGAVEVAMHDLIARLLDAEVLITGTVATVRPNRGWPHASVELDRERCAVRSVHLDEDPRHVDYCTAEAPDGQVFFCRLDGSDDSPRFEDAED